MQKEKEKFEIIDIHSHLQFPEFDFDREDVLAKMMENKIASIVVGTDFESSKKALDLAIGNENIFASIGLHPCDNVSEDFDKNKYQELINQDKEKNIVAIGECGLDYFHLDKSNLEILEKNKKRQEKIFREQIVFALENDLALMIHARDAYTDILKILKEYKEKWGEKLRGNVHFFAGSLEEAREFNALGFTISFTGVITFAKSYDEIIREIEIRNIQIETDAPFVAPKPYRGKKCESNMVVEVLNKISKLKNLEKEALKKALRENNKRVFGI